MKKKMDLLTKAKLIYSGELLLFAIAFFVIALLEFIQVIKISDRHHMIFNWVTIFGGTWLIVDFFWALFDKKRRKRVALIDKIIHLPVGIYLISFDLFCLISKPTNRLVYQYGIPAAICYLFICYTFEAIYHFFYPVPGLVDIKEDNKQVIEGQAEIGDDNDLPNEEERKEENENGTRNESNPNE